MQFTRRSGNGLIRSRWAAAGAAIAVSLGAGGLFVASAAPSPAASFVAVTPVRLVDTRVDLGLDGPLGSMMPEIVQITGTIDTLAGQAVVVPSAATAVVGNVTVVAPTASGFLSVRPGDVVGGPSTSTLNFPRQQTLANAVTVQLPVDGDVEMYYRAAGGATADTVHLVFDVVGYYVEGGSGEQGPAGPQGPQGEPGAGGSGLVAQFFALAPPDNAATVAVGADVEFPQDGPSTASATIVRASASTFLLASVGVHRVSFQVPITEGGQLVLTLDGVELAYTVTGRFTGTTSISGESLVEVTVPNSLLTLRNPAGSPTALQVTPLAGGAAPAAATLVIDYIG